MSIKKTSLAIAILAAFSTTSAYAVNLVTNGDFETNAGQGQLTNASGGITTADGWTTAASATDGTAVPFNFILNDTADDGTSGFGGGFTSVNSAGVGSNIFVYGPGNGHANGFTGSPTGGYFLGGDGGYATGAISQVINGLTPGQSYTLAFDWAGAQFTDVSGDYYVGWQVNFGSETAQAGNTNVASQGFAAWSNFTHTFTPTSDTQTLSFLALGPTGLPPFSLLDGVSLTPDVPIDPTPIPAALPFMVSGLMGIFGLSRRRKAA